MKHFPQLIILSLCSLVPAQGATVLFADRTTFESGLSNFETEDYSGIANGLYNDTQIDALLGANVPVHRTTGGTGSNQIFQSAFNASNTTFRITFTNTNVGTTGGVFGVAFDYGQVNAQMSAFVTFGDNTTQNYTLAADPSPFSTPDFFGITSDELIESIHISIPSNTPGITSSSFVFDNLTYGGNLIPEPSTALLSIVPLAAFGFRRRRA